MKVEDIPINRISIRIEKRDVYFDVDGNVDGDDGDDDGYDDEKSEVLV